MAKSLLAVSAILYILGFVVVSIHYYSLGVPPAGFLRTDYLAAAFWLLLPFLVFGSLVVFGAAAFKMTVEMVSLSPRVPPWLIWIFCFVGSLYSLAAVLTYVAVRFVPTSIMVASRPHLLELTRYAMWPIGFSLFLAVAYRLSTIKLPENHSLAALKGIARPVVLMSAVFIVFTGLEYLFWFSNTLFSVVPRTLGGGAPQQITIDSPPFELTKQKIELLADTDGYFFVRAAGSNEVVAISKSTLTHYVIHP